MCEYSRNGLNYDYVLAVEKDENGRLRLISQEIYKNDDLLAKLEQMMSDSNLDSHDMVRIVKNQIGNTESIFSDCVCHKYNDSYIKVIEFPRQYGYDYYSMVMNSIKKNMKNSKWRLRRMNAMLSEDEIEAIMQEQINERWHERNINDKKECIQACRDYITAYDYNRAKNVLLENGNVIAYSNEVCGRYTYKYEVNKDIVVSVNTNFCYGSSSYMTVVVRYKGIELVPYSVLVKYYFSRFIDIKSCTMAYLPERESWSDCLKFIVSFVNCAIDNPDEFIRERVLSEVHNMIEGLRLIKQQTPEKLNKELELAKPNPDVRYSELWFRFQKHFDKKYAVYPNEMFLVYKFGKITAALRFLDNLKRFAAIYSEIENAIAEIEQMNKDIYPEILSVLPSIEADVNRLQKLYDREYPILCEYRRIHKEFEDKLKCLLMRNPGQKDEITKTFEEENPLYRDNEKQKDKQEAKVNKISTELCERRAFLEYIVEYKSRIERANVLNPAV